MRAPRPNLNLSVEFPPYPTTAHPSLTPHPKPSPQVTAGPCDTPKPFWNALERAKWNSWNSLGSLGKLDAMRMYVSGIEDENPDWYDLVTNDGDEERVAEVAEAAAEAVAAAGMDAKAQLARLNDTDTTQAETKEPKGGTTPTPPRRKSSLTALHTSGSPRPSTDLHHSSGNTNFGLYFTWWDRWMGTEHPRYREEFRKVTARTRKAMREGERKPEGGTAAA